MRFAILGPLEVHRGEERPRIDSPLQRQLLAVLIARGTNPAPADTLTGALWGDTPPGDARKALGWHMHELRKVLGGRETIVNNAAGYLLEHRPEDVDAVRFEALLDQAAAERERPEAAETALDAALRLWRGPAYTGLTDAAPLRDEANRLEELRLTALERHASVRLELGRHDELTAELTRLVAEHPYRERFREQLMLALYRCGRQADALAVYRRGQERIAAELGLDPGPGLRRMQQRILGGDTDLDPPSRPADRSPSSDAVVPRQLPAAVGGFTGRDRELEQLLASVRPGLGTSVTALDGMAGVGKTALAVHLAHRLAPRFPDGQLFVDLHGYSGEIAPVSPAEALDRMLRALGVAARRIPGHIDERSALLRSVLSGRRVLLLLDNAADEQQVRPLLPGTGGNLTLVTSRRRFGELDDAVLVSLGVLGPESGAALFTGAAGLAETDGEQRELVGAVVEQCGRLPLALRIAAQQLRRRASWTLSELRERLSVESRTLETLSVRDRSVPAAFQLSYRDLDAEQQRTFRLLSVFPQAHFDAQAAAALADIPLPVARHQLDDMVDAHLLDSPEPGVYGFHDLMRQFAAAASRHTETDTGREAASFRLLDVYHSNAFAASARLTGRPRTEPGPAAPTSPVEPFTADIDLGVDRPSMEVAVGKAIGLGVDAHVWRWGDIGREPAPDPDSPELRRLLDRATEALDAATDDPRRATGFNNLGAVQLLHHRYPEAVEYFERSLRLRERFGDVRGRAAVLNSLGVAHSQLGNLDAAASFDRAMSSAFQSGAEDAEAHAIDKYVILADYLDMHEQALPLLNRARDIFSRDAHPRRLARLSFCFGVVYGGLSQPERALRHLHRAREYAESAAEYFGLSHTLTAIAVNQRRLGEHADAVTSHRRAIRAGARVDDPGLKARNLVEFGRTRLALRETDAALGDFRRGAELAAAAGHRYEQARAEHGLADCHQALGDPVAAQRHLRECVRIYTDIGAPQARRLRERLEPAAD